jgi:hypothetical protein
MISHYLQSIEGIEVLGIGSLVICFVVFVGIVIRAVRADQAYINTMEQLPLDAHDHSTVSSDEVHQ